jgi:hypothetical protein
MSAGYNGVVKSITARREAVAASDALIASNLRDCRPAIKPSKLPSTHSHFTWAAAHRLLPMSMSSPASWPLGNLYSYGG